MQGKKILIVVSNMFGGGAQRVVSRLANVLAEGNDVTVFTGPTASTYPLSGKIKVVNFKYHDIPLLNRFGFLGAKLYFYVSLLFLRRQLSRLKKELSPDATVSFLDYPNLLNAITFGSGRKVMSERNNPKMKGRRYYLCEVLSFLFADKVVFQTRTVMNMFPSIIRRKGVVIRNPVNVNCLAIGEGKKIVTMGRLHPQKNHELLIRAFARFSESHPHHTLHIYGKFYEESRLQELIGKLALADKVFLEGFKDDVHEAVSDAEQFVLSSDYEGVPNALLEAMMMGLPCVSTDFDGVREMLSDSEACLLTPVGDEKALADAMASLSDDPSLRSELSRRGRLFSRDYSLDKVVPLWSEALFN